MPICCPVRLLVQEINQQRRWSEMQIQTVEKGPSAKQLVFQKIAFYTSFQRQNSFINKEGVQMNSRTQVKKFIIALAIVFSDALCFARCAPLR